MDNLFSTHPSTQNRVRELQRLAGEAGSRGGPAAAPVNSSGGSRGPWGGTQRGPWGEYAQGDSEGDPGTDRALRITKGPIQFC